MANPDPEAISWLRILTAFVVVFGLIALLGYALKYLNLRGITRYSKTGQDRRIEIIENVALDIRRRLVIVRCDDKEHLLLLGFNQDIVVEANLKARPSSLDAKNAI